MSIPAGYDWARNVFGFSSLPLSAVFAVLSALFLVDILYNSLIRVPKRPIYNWLIGWGVLRLVGFVLRAVCLTGSLGSNSTLVITTQVFLSIGYIPLLKVFIQNVFIIAKVVHPKAPYGPIERLVNLLTLAFVVCIIVYLNMYFPDLPNPITSTEQTLRDAAYWGLTALAALPTLYIFRVLGDVRFTKVVTTLLIQGALLLIKIGFSLYKNYQGGLNDEIYFYLLTILPEFLYMAFYLLPGYFADLMADIAAGGEGGVKVELGSVESGQGHNYASV
ncbi:hypothetical protein HK100_002731 [Physocladia obscura]|uniref:Uncharacterized protein n=1 Tax=Physocladia obscura TaxID=109957 RepID=A0AAD5SVZ1_9FUNG|nr:hypothetical protein HK100_002731 [Physocladia obscura]